MTALTSRFLTASTTLALVVALGGCPPSKPPPDEEDAGPSTSSSAMSSSGGSSGTATSSESGDPSGGSSGPVSGSGSTSSSGGVTSGFTIRTPDPYEPTNDRRDSDCDGLTDQEEFDRTYPGGGQTSPTNADSDGDGLLDGVEAGRTQIVAGDAALCPAFPGDQDPSTRTDPTNPDTDGDGIPDGLEDLNRNGQLDPGETNPRSTDSDGDGLPDGLEDATHDGIRQDTETSPALRDTDGDGIPDGIEDVNRNGIREPSETNPRNPDTDGDGLLDGDEDRNWNHVVDPGETDPLVPDVDTDQDGIPDTRETELGYDINDPDMDDDGLLDGQEDRNKNGVVDINETNPRHPDSDCDGLRDGEEDANKNGLLDPGETDPLVADSDGDLLLDGLERGKTQNPDPVRCTGFTPDAHPASTTDPRNADSDNDGINDGIEDFNFNGQVDPGETDPNNPDTDNDGMLDGQEDANHNHRVDVGETDPLVPDTDSDGDGLPDFAEDLYGTSRSVQDTDGDGLKDGLEDRNHDGLRNMGETDALSQDSDCDGLSDGEEDANRNGVREATETDPLNPDSDGDGILDGVELGRTVNLDPVKCTAFVAAGQPANVTDPLNPDSDGDDVPDGAEDANQNGRLDPGELDPTNPADGTQAVRDVCTQGNLVPITFHPSDTPVPDLQLATLSSFSGAHDIVLAGEKVGLIRVDPAANAPVIVFAYARAPTPAELTANAIAANTTTSLGAIPGGVRNPITQALPCLNFPHDCTWDGFPAVLGSYDLRYAGDAFDLVNTVLNRLLPGVTPPLAASLGVTGPFKLRMQFVRRSGNRAVILGAIMPDSTYAGSTAFKLEDVGNGTSLSQVGDTAGVQCDLFATKPYPKADILFVIDNSGSMGDDQGALGIAADAMVTQLRSSLIDWRVGRISSDADDPHRDEMPVAVEYGDAEGTLSADAHIWPFIKPADDSPEAFATASAIIRDKLMKPGTRGWGIEAALEPMRFSLQGNPQAANRYLPAAEAGADDPWKVRADARLAVLIVSDAGEQSNSQLRMRRGWTEGQDGTILAFLRGGPQNNAALPATQNTLTWDTNRLDEPPMFIGGIFTPLGVVAQGEETSTGNSVFLGIYHHMVEAMGGVVGSLTDTNSIGPSVQAFMAAMVGNASPYALTKAPISASIKVAMEGQPVTGCNWSDIPRSRQNGYDYDGATRQITFYGHCRPSNDPGSLGARMAVSYRYWVDNTRNPDGAPAPCGNACLAPLVCNPTTNQCECPGNCGLVAGCPTPRVCDTAPNVCACACPADCGGSPPNPRFRCDSVACAFRCPADCGGAAPGPGFVCNQTRCQYECAGCDPSTRPSLNSERYQCDLTTCQWSCPETCGVVNPGPEYRCDRYRCEYTCTADCGGHCTDTQSCNAAGCQCQCNPNATCAPGYRFDTTACACVCDTEALNCGAAREPDASACACKCRPNCGNTCDGNTYCELSLCYCEMNPG
jgi:hypothetical protein